MAKKVTSGIPQYNFQKWRHGVGLGGGGWCLWDGCIQVHTIWIKKDLIIHSWRRWSWSLLSVHGERARDNRDKLKIWHCHIDTRRRISPGTHWGSATGCPGGLCSTHPWSFARLDKRNPQGFLSEVMAESVWRWLGEYHAEVLSNLNYPVTL